MIKYTLTRSKRKSVCIYIRSGAVEVRAPIKMAQKDIDDFVTSKALWIAKKLELSAKCLWQQEDFRLGYGDFITYRGNEHPIYAKEGRHVGFDNKGFFMPPDLDDNQIKAACVQIYKMLAKKDITQKVLEFSKKMRVSPLAVKINSAKTQWGSCSSKKSINFSWRLVMACDDVIDYVVVHELAHLIEMNHSSRFWTVVENFMPNYNEQKKLLKDLQKRLSTQKWD